MRFFHSILSRIRSFTPEDKLALLLVFAGGILRFYQYAGWSLSNDELSAITRLKFSTFSEMIEKGVRTNDMHPPGVQAFLWFWTAVFGESEISLRFPFVLLGTLSTGLLYLIGRNLFSSLSALLATSCFAALQFPLLYSQLARPYSPGLFFSLLMLYALTELMRRDPFFPLRNAALFIVAGAGCMYSHYFSFLFAGLTGVAGFFFISGRNRLKYLAAGLVMFLLFSPAFSVFATQVSIGGLGGSEGWLGPPGKDALWNYLKYCFNDSLWLPGILLSSAIGFPLMNRLLLNIRTARLWTSRQTLVLFLFVTPALVAYYYSIYKNPVFQYSVLFFSFPCLLLLLFSWCESRTWHTIMTVQVVIILMLTAFSTVIEKKYYSAQLFARFRSVAEGIGSYSRKFGKDACDVSVNVIHPDYIHYYADRFTPGMKFLQYNCDDESDYVELNRIVQTSDARYFIHGWANCYHAPETEMIIRTRFPFQVARDTFFNSGLIVFSKDSTARTTVPYVPLYEVMNGFESSIWENDVYFRTDSIAYDGKWSIRMRPEYEYSPGIKGVAGDIGVAQGATVELQFSCLSRDSLKEAKAVISIEREGSSILWRGIPIGPFQSVKKGAWSEFFMGYRIIEEVLPTDKVLVYCYNPAKEEFWLDDFVFAVRK